MVTVLMEDLAQIGQEASLDLIAFMEHRAHTDQEVSLEAFLDQVGVIVGQKVDMAWSNLDDNVYLFFFLSNLHIIEVI